ncbi:hypothetical protein [Treponema phagedenis]|uniref:Uncharacterized protein n=1 Tax=Treponema phagedenis TaxID=162 RepID=A0AAE6IT49_TREPH|nr:hypothetical protein [Treponema phagedenis]QEJ97790.1 hypothetical protein FUT82_07125 [Treponema phagedenis]QEK03356.1 hypothetical protein FUT83_05735 [Treponema phagedenis]QEK08984.1 hypothetical protein FUT81_05715 [Treponema phagedenis]
MSKFMLPDIPENFADLSHEKQKEFADAIFEVLYFNSARILYPMRYVEEELFDFLLLFYQNLTTTIKKYNRNLSKFSTYIIGSFRFSYKSFKRKQMQNKIMQNTLLYHEKSGLETENSYHMETGYQSAFAASNEPAYTVSVEPKMKEVKTERKKKIRNKTLLLLACKSCLHIDDDLIKKIAATIEMEFSDLYKIILNQRQKLANKDQKLQKIRERRNAYYIKALLYEKLHSRTEPFSENQERYRERIEFYRRNWEKACNDYKQVKKTPSNRNLAEVIAMSRGSVDKYLAQVEENI